MESKKQVPDNELQGMNEKHVAPALVELQSRTCTGWDVLPLEQRLLFRAP